MLRVVIRTSFHTLSLGITSCFDGYIGIHILHWSIEFCWSDTLWKKMKIEV